jgi:hypothetical protein
MGLKSKIDVLMYSGDEKGSCLEKKRSSKNKNQKTPKKREEKEVFCFYFNKEKELQRIF